MTNRLLAPLALLAAVAAAFGCGGSDNEPDDRDVGPRSDRLVDFSKDPPYLNGLDVDPNNGDFLLTTNRGFWRIDAKADKVTQIKGTIAAQGKKDTVGTFLEIEPMGGQTLIGSGHPDRQNTLPQYLGFIRSDDMGKTWKVVSRLGDADLHKVIPAHGRIYAFDAVLSAMLITEDEGRTFQEVFTPRGLIIDFVVDPEDPEYVLASTEQQLFRNEDLGDNWRPLLAAEGIRLAWPAPDALYRADKNGTVHTSADRGGTWKEVAAIDGEPYKFETTDDPQHLYLALSDGTIMETTDGAKTWKVAFKP